MRLEIVRAVADWLIDKGGAGFGVNAYIPTVPIDTGDNRPDTIAGFSSSDFPNTTIGVFDPRHPWVAEGKEPPVYPALYVMAQGRLLLEGAPNPSGQIRRTLGSGAEITIRYVTQNTDKAAAMQAGEYTLRAVVRSLRQLDSNDNQAARTRNGIYMELSMDPIEYWPVQGSVGNARVAGAILVRYLARDGMPSF